MSPPSPQSIICFLADCYRADRRVGGISNLLDRRLEHRILLEGREPLISGEIESLPLDPEAFDSMAKATALHLRERSLVYFAFPIIGRPRSEKKQPGLCAPLLTWPASLSYRPDSKDLLWLEVALQEQQTNLLPLAKLLGGEAEASETLESLLENLPQAPFDAGAIIDIARMLPRALPEIDVGSLAGYPELVGENELRAAVRDAKNDGYWRCLPACGLALVRNSLGTRGISHELSLLGKASLHSPPLSQLLSGNANQGQVSVPEEARGRPWLPAVLSEAQRRAVKAAATRSLTLVVGPPGTGKSYTLAAIALERLCRGESVLLSGRSEQAIDVLIQKIELLLGAPSPVLRAGRSTHQREVADRLERLLHGHDATAGGGEEGLKALGEKVRVLEKDLGSIDKRLDGLEKTLLKRAALEMRWGDAEMGEARGVAKLFQSMGQSFLGLRLERLPEHWRLLEEYEEILQSRAKRVARLLAARLNWCIASVLVKNRAHLKRFVQAIRARHSSRQKALMEQVDLGVLLQALPLWASTFSDAHRAMPMSPSMFDLVIVDEATQCDMATCMPILQRGRRALVTGDPKQLRHVSFLRRTHQRILLERNGLTEDMLPRFDYRDRSLLDLVSDTVEDQDGVAFLDEHFRSRPDLIAFSNRAFYGGALRVMTERPAIVHPPALTIHRVQGRRTPEGHNRIEAETLIADLVKWVEKERNLPEKRVHDLGVLSPFRDQVDLLEGRIGKALSLSDIERHRIKVDTAYGFQGEERDVIFISFALDSTSPAAAFRYLDREGVFNVAITRARSFQRLYCSLDAGEAAGSPLLREYLERANDRGPKKPDGPKIRDPFLIEVETELVETGYSVWPAFTVAGEMVDLLVVRDGVAVGVDLVGYPGDFAEALDLERCRISLRAGLRIFPLPFSAWRQDRGRCMTALAAWFEPGPASGEYFWSA